MNSLSRYKYVVKRYKLESGSQAGQYTFEYKTDLAYNHVECVGFSEFSDGLLAGNHYYTIGLKQSQGENVLLDPIPKVFLLTAGLNLTNNLRFDDRFLPMGYSMPAGGISYTLTLVTSAALTEDLQLDVVYKLVNYEVKL